MFVIYASGCQMSCKNIWQPEAKVTTHITKLLQAPLLVCCPSQGLQQCNFKETGNSTMWATKHKEHALGTCWLTQCTLWKLSSTCFAAHIMLLWRLLTASI